MFNFYCILYCNIWYNFHHNVHTLLQRPTITCNYTSSMLHINLITNCNHVFTTAYHNLFLIKSWPTQTEKCIYVPVYLNVNIFSSAREDKGLVGVASRSNSFWVRGLQDGLSWVTDVTGQDEVIGQDFVFSCPLYFFPHSFSSSYFLPLFHCLISILLTPCASVRENTRAWVPYFL